MIRTLCFLFVLSSCASEASEQSDLPVSGSVGMLPPAESTLELRLYANGSITLGDIPLNAAELADGLKIKASETPGEPVDVGGVKVELSGLHLLINADGACTYSQLEPILLLAARVNTAVHRIFLRVKHAGSSREGAFAMFIPVDSARGPGPDASRIHGVWLRGIEEIPRAQRSNLWRALESSHEERRRDGEKGLRHWCELLIQSDTSIQTMISAADLASRSGFELISHTTSASWPQHLRPVIKLAETTAGPWGTLPPERAFVEGAYVGNATREMMPMHEEIPVEEVEIEGK